MGKQRVNDGLANEARYDGGLTSMHNALNVR